MLAIIRDRLLATHVTIGPTLDVYNAAFRIPDLIYGTLLAFVTAGTVVPFLTKENSHGVILDPRQKLFSLTLFFGGLLGIFSGIAALFLPLYAHYIVPGFTQEQLDQFIFATRLLLLQPFFLGVTSLISCFAQLRNEFILYGISPLGYSSGIIFGILYLYPVYGLRGLLYGVIIGSIVALGIQLLSLRNARLREIRYHFSYRHVHNLVALAIPRTGTNITSQIRIIFFTGLATTFGPGSLSSYLFAHRITDAVTQLIQQSITTASLPVLSKEYIEGRQHEYKKTVRRYLAVLGIVGVMVSSIIYFFRDAVIFVLYGNTLYNEYIAFYLQGLLLILPLTMISGYLSISLYAMKDTRRVFVAMVISTILSISVGSYYKSEGEMALIYAYVSFAVSQLLLLGLFYSRKKSTDNIS